MIDFEWPPRAGDLWQDEHGGRWFARGPQSGERDVRLYPPLTRHEPTSIGRGPRPEGWKLLARFGDDGRDVLAKFRWSAPQIERLLGHATWVWDQDLGMHLPMCSGWKHDTRRGGLYMCGNGPLTGENIDTGLCDEGPHLEPHERSI